MEKCLQTSNIDVNHWAFYKIGPIRFDDHTKQHSVSWMSKLVLEKRILGIGTEFVIFNQEKVAWLETFCFGAKNAQNQVFVEYKFESRKLCINLQKALYCMKCVKKLILAIFRAKENISLYKTLKTSSCFIEN